MIEIQSACKFFGSPAILDQVTLSIPSRSIVGLAGPSGSGKSTLLQCIQGLQTIDSGRITRKGTPGFMFQDFNLLDTLTISENIALALTINKVPAGEIDGRVREMAGKLNITDILDKYHYQVSGGQKQRWACARAIIN